MSRPILRRVAVLLIGILSAAGALGLFVGSADADCAGPQLILEQGDASIAPRIEGADEEEVYDVRRDAVLTVRGRNLTGDCNDTNATAVGGCSSTPDPPRPFQNADLTLVQGSQRWALAQITADQDLEATVMVDLPAALRPGPARLVLDDGGEGMSASLNFVII